jgi:hypothetical protein
VRGLVPRGVEEYLRERYPASDRKKSVAAIAAKARANGGERPRKRR